MDNLGITERSGKPQIIESEFEMARYKIKRRKTVSNKTRLSEAQRGRRGRMSPSHEGNRYVITYFIFWLQQYCLYCLVPIVCYFELPK